MEAEGARMLSATILARLVRRCFLEATGMMPQHPTSALSPLVVDAQVSMLDQLRGRSTRLLLLFEPRLQHSKTDIGFEQHGCLHQSLGARMLSTSILARLLRRCSFGRHRHHATAPDTGSEPIGCGSQGVDARPASRPIDSSVAFLGSLAHPLQPLMQPSEHRLHPPHGPLGNPWANQLAEDVPQGTSLTDPPFGDAGFVKTDVCPQCIWQEPPPGPIRDLAGPFWTPSGPRLI